MHSKAIRTAALSLAALAIPAGVLVAPLPASAVTSGSLCEAYSSKNCLNTANFNLYTPVTEGKNNARTIDAVLQNGTTFKLEFNGDPSMCVASDNSGTEVEVKSCSVSDALWTKGSSGGYDTWINQQATETWGANYYLTGIGIAGDQFTLNLWDEATGDLQRYKFN